MTDTPPPTLTTTYRRADGESIWDEYDWVVNTEFFDDLDEPTEVIEETWERTSVRTITFKPSWWVDDPCDNCGDSIAEHSDDEAADCWIEAGGAA